MGPKLNVVGDRLRLWLWRPKDRLRLWLWRPKEDAERPISLVVGGDANHGKWNDHASRDQMRIKGRSPDIPVAREGVNNSADPVPTGSENHHWMIAC